MGVGGGGGKEEIPNSCHLQGKKKSIRESSRAEFWKNMGVDHLLLKMVHFPKTVIICIKDWISMIFVIQKRTG